MFLFFSFSVPHVIQSELRKKGYFFLLSRFGEPYTTYRGIPESHIFHQCSLNANNKYIEWEMKKKKKKGVLTKNWPTRWVYPGIHLFFFVIKASSLWFFYYVFCSHFLRPKTYKKKHKNIYSFFKKKQINFAST